MTWRPGGPGCRAARLPHSVAMEPSCFSPDVLKGQVAFVTGGATGIGSEICPVLGAHGAQVTMASRKTENLGAAVATLRAEGIDAAFGVCDVPTRRWYGR